MRNAVAAAVCAVLGFFVAVPPALAGGRVLAPMDAVSIWVLDEPNLSATTHVAPDGTINFPYVGRIRAAGRTEDQLGRTIERRLIELKILRGS
jgi:polysaccharide export outer membrane protein